MLDDVVPIDPVDAPRRHRPRLGQVKVHVGSPEDVGVDPAGKVYSPGSDIYFYFPCCRGDRLLTLDGRWTDSLPDLYEAAGHARPGAAAVLKVKRGGKELELKVTPLKGF